MVNSSSAKQLSTGSPLGRYELLLPVAKGGMAEVWAARLHGTRGFQKVVAVKTILSGAIDDARLEEMFLAEAELASKIHHPNVVATLDLGEHEGILYLVMEWVDGESLNLLMSRAGTVGGVPLPIGVNLIGQACQGLYAAHSLRDDQGSLLGVVHRDVSPHNLLVTYSGTAKLVDFGIAKATSLASSTVAGEVKGKFAYMAPEQVRAQAVDARADLFALGILLYQITTGRHPFRGENPAETVQNICADGGPAPPSTLLSDYPAELEAVVLKALAKDPDQRFSSATELLTALEKAMPGPLEASFQVQVAEYLEQLFGTRATARRTALRVAQERVDRQRGEQSSSISQGTLRAIAIDAVAPDPTDAPSSSQTLRRISTPPVSQQTPVLTPAAVPATRSKQVIFALAAPLAIVAGALMTLSSSNSSRPEAAADSMAPVEKIIAPPAKVEASIPSPQIPTPAIASVSVARVAPSEPILPASERAPEAAKKLPTERKLATRNSRPATGSPLPAAPPALAPPSASPMPTASNSGPSANRLGRGAFGGRH